MARRGDLHDKVAGLAHQVVQAVSFGAQYQRAIHVVVDFVVEAVAALVESHGPDIFLLELFNRAVDVGDLGHRHVLRRTCRRLRHRRIHSHGAALGNDDAIHTGGIGRAQNRAQVVRIFHAVEHDQERPLTTAFLQQVFDVGIFLRRSNCDHSLVVAGRREAIQVRTRNGAHRHAQRAALADDLVHALIVAFARHADVLEGTSAGLQRFQNGVDAVNDGHRKSVIGNR